MNDVVEIDFNLMGRSKQIPLESNGNIYIYVMKMQLDNGYKMVSVYLHNNDKSDGDEKEYAKVMFQVEMLIADDLMSPIFVPEYLCRKVELEDEYYYKGRPVYARGRGCAATWEKKAEEINATAIKSSFIPDYEIPSVSAQIDDMPEHAFSMLQMGSPKKKSEVIQNLRTLTEMYGSWITDALTNDEAMHDDKFKTTGQTIIDKCNDANRRMNAGIDLIENNDKVYQAFVFMNQAMYLQRSITAFSKDYGNGIPCSLRDYMTDMPEKGRKKDHSEWRPFQIAFVLLNLYGIMDGESPERNIVDLLYFPTGGGKTEAYLGLIAFTIAYRRLTASDETDYEKDGGVTVFLRYTLRLLTTQQRDRLMRLIVAMEQLREKNEKLYGKERISIGFWVGGNVTPNKFSEYSDSDQFKKKEFIRKLTKQIIKCPYCGKEITRDEYDINEKGKYVKIHCADKNCMFSLKTGRTIPVYLVDEEIYAKCPTVIISTVDKFARLPWSERVGLLFGRTDRYCSRCGHIAIGEKHTGRHNADVAAGLERAETVACKPFYPPELIISNSGTFHFICRDCDSKLFQEYENVDALQEIPTEKMLAEIALKDILLMLSKRNQEKRIYQKGKQKGILQNVEVMEEIQQLDNKDYMDELNLYKDVLYKNSCNNFKIIMWKKIPYVVPIATQTLVALPKDTEGIEINNIYDMRPEVRMQNIHIGVFPMNDYSIVYAFYHRRDRLYRRLHHQMNCMSLEKKLELINYWIFKYTENYYISPEIQIVIDKDDKLKELSRENNGMPNLGYVTTMDFLFHKDEIKPSEVTNLLREMYAVKK